MSRKKKGEQRRKQLRSADATVNATERRTKAELGHVPVTDLKWQQKQHSCSVYSARAIMTHSRRVAFLFREFPTSPRSLSLLVCEGGETWVKVGEEEWGRLVGWIERRDRHFHQDYPAAKNLIWESGPVLIEHTRAHAASGGCPGKPPPAERLYCCWTLIYGVMLWIVCVCVCVCGPSVLVVESQWISSHLITLFICHASPNSCPPTTTLQLWETPSVLLFIFHLCSRIWRLWRFNMNERFNVMLKQLVCTTDDCSLTNLI